jgi:hypothetical protein
MEDLNSIPGFKEIFKMSHPELAKMKTAEPIPALHYGGEPLKGRNGLNILLLVVGVGLGIGIAYYFVTENRRKNAKPVDDRSKRRQNLNYREIPNL